MIISAGASLDVDTATTEIMSVLGLNGVFAPPVAVIVTIGFIANMVIDKVYDSFNMNDRLNQLNKEARDYKDEEDLHTFNPGGVNL